MAGLAAFAAAGFRRASGAALATLAAFAGLLLGVVGAAAACAACWSVGLLLELSAGVLKGNYVVVRFGANQVIMGNGDFEERVGFNRYCMQ